MALTRDFKETIQARARHDARYRQALFTEAMNAYLAGDTIGGKAMLRDLVNATVGFEALAAALDKPSKSLHRMLGPEAIRARRISSKSSACCRNERASSSPSRQKPPEKRVVAHRRK